MRLRYLRHGLAAALALTAVCAHAGETRRLEVRNDKGAMAYDLYLPSGYSPTGAAMPLVVNLHGGYSTTAQAAQYSGWNTLAEQHGFIVAYPAESVNNGFRNGVWNWSAPARQGRDDRAASLIALITRTVEQDYRVDTKRVLLAGISAGAGMAVAVSANYPELYTAVGVEAGCAYGIWRAWDFPCTLGGCIKGAFANLYFSGDSSAEGAYRAMGAQARRMPAIMSYGDQDNLSWAVGQQDHLDMWLGLNDWIDDGAANGSVPRQAALEAQGGGAGTAFTRSVYKDARGCALVERVVITGMDHKYSGAHYPDGSTGLGPDMRLRQYQFMLEQAALKPPCGP